MKKIILAFSLMVPFQIFAAGDCTNMALDAVKQVEFLNKELDEDSRYTVAFLRSVQLQDLGETVDIYQVESRGYYDITGHYEVMTTNFPTKPCYVTKVELKSVTD